MRIVCIKTSKEARVTSMNREALIGVIESALPLISTPGSAEMSLSTLLHYAANEPPPSRTPD